MRITQQSMGKLRVLCIHGYRQNESSFRERTGALRKLLKKEVDFCFLSAPHVIPEPQNLARPEEEQERGWWFSKPDSSYYALDRTDCCLGFQASIETIHKAFEEQGPFDGIVGFQSRCSVCSSSRGHKTERTGRPYSIQICDSSSCI